MGPSLLRGRFSTILTLRNDRKCVDILMFFQTIPTIKGHLPVILVITESGNGLSPACCHLSWVSDQMMTAVKRDARSKVQWNLINSLWPSYVIWQHMSGSTLAQVMAWCLMASSHYLNQCLLLLIMRVVLWHLPWINVIRNVQDIYLWSIFDTSLKITNLILQPHLSGANEFKNPY